MSGDPDWAPDVGRRPGVREVAPGQAQFTEVVGALHCALDVLDRLGAADLRASAAALQGGRAYVLTRTLPGGYDVPYRFAPAIPANARALVSAYQAACRATSRALTGMDRLVVAVGAPSRILAAARSAARPVVSADRDRAPGAGGAVPGTSAGYREATVVPEGPVAQAMRRPRGSDPVFLLRATAIDMAASALIEEAKGASQPRSTNVPTTATTSQTGVAALSFPLGAQPTDADCRPDGFLSRDVSTARRADKLPPFSP